VRDDQRADRRMEVRSTRGSSHLLGATVPAAGRAARLRRSGTGSSSLGNRATCWHGCRSSGVKGQGQDSGSGQGLLTGKRHAW
jgi:hypothetical protein